MHLVVLVHGLLGSPQEFDFMLAHMRKTLPSASTQYLVSKCNASWRGTLQGVDVGGARLFDEVVAVLNASRGNEKEV